MNKNLKYIGYFTLPDIFPERSISFAARNKMIYTAEVLKQFVHTVEMISPANIKKGETGGKGVYKEINDKIKLLLFPTFKNTNRYWAILNNNFIKLQLFLYLLTHTSKNEPIILYHSLALVNIILLAKKIKKFKLILELNEIYSDVISNRNVTKNYKKEIKIINAADAFIFPNDLMNGMFNLKNKPFAIEYGVYNAAPLLSKNKFNNDRIHVVYAGTFDPAKGGAQVAIEAATFLPDNYNMHILGFGTEDQIKKIKTSIQDIQSHCKCQINYEGLLDGNEFISFLQKSDIGLSTQLPGAKYNDTSFPSKILTYLANGLKVVSIDIPVVSQSKLKNAITFYKNQTPKEVAEAITSVSDFSPNYSLLKELDQDFKYQIKRLLEHFI